MRLPWAGLPWLKSLDLPSNATSQSVTAIANLTELESLSIAGEHFDDDGIPALLNFKNLKSIHFGAGVTPAGVEMLAELPDIDQIYIGDRLDDSFMAVYTKFPKLRQLNLAHTSVTVAGLPHLAKMKNMDTLSLPPSTTDAEMEYLVDLPKLRSLNLEYSQVTDVGISKLEKMKNLKSILLPLTCTDACLDVFAGREMASIHIKGAGFTDAAIPKLLALKSLNSLAAGNTKITPAGLDKLRTRRPPPVIHFVPEEEKK